MVSSIVCDMPDRLCRRCLRKTANEKQLVPFYVVPTGGVGGESYRGKMEHAVSRMEEDRALVQYRVEMEAETMAGWLWWGKQEMGQLGERMGKMEREVREVYRVVQEARAGTAQLEGEMSVLCNVIAQRNTAHVGSVASGSMWG